MTSSESCVFNIKINTPTHLERAVPSSPSSSACGCSAWTLCPASWPKLASTGFLRHTGSSAPSASSHTEPSTPGAVCTRDTPMYHSTLSTPQKHLLLRKVGGTINCNNSKFKSSLRHIPNATLSSTVLTRQTSFTFTYI